jgi:hypothetical protein
MDTRFIEAIRHLPGQYKLVIVLASIVLWRTYTSCFEQKQL